MKINVLNLLKSHTILGHLILKAGNSEYKQQFEEVTKTVHSSKDNLLDIKIIYNGIEFDGQILEDLLQEQYTLLGKRLENKYSDLEKLAQEKAQKMFNEKMIKHEGSLLKKLEQINEKITDIYTELKCL